MIGQSKFFYFTSLLLKNVSSKNAAVHKQIGANSSFFDRDTLVNFEPGEYMRKMIF